jgi:hypothetical protein
VMLVVEQDHLVARRRIGQADAAGAWPSAILRSAPRAASSASDSANRCENCSAARPRMRKGIIVLHRAEGEHGGEDDDEPPDLGTRFLARSGLIRSG